MFQGAFLSAHLENYIMEKLEEKQWITVTFLTKDIEKDF